MSLWVPTSTTFNIKPAVLLENLKQKLELPTDWKRIPQDRHSVRTYRHGNYCIGIISDKTRVAQIVIESVSSDTVALNCMCELVAYVMTEVSPTIDNPINVITSILPPESKPVESFTAQRNIDGVIYRSLVTSGAVGIIITKV